MKLNNNIKFFTILFTVFGIFLMSGLFERQVSANMHYFELFGGFPLQQDWTDTGQITADDDWTTNVSFQGFRGDGLTSGIGVDPQTIVADGQTTTPLDVNANEVNPSTFSTGGVAEFDSISNPTIALKGSGTADAPHLMVYLDTTPCPVTKSVSIRYNVRDLDASSNDSVQQLALQYRIGSTGNFINLPAGFVADATEPNTATKVTPRLVNLPATIINNPQVEVRFITTNAAGTDEWIGIDDVNVGCFFPTSAGVSMGGKVLSHDGQAVSRANVTIQNTFTLRRQFTRTNQFGYFNFNDLDAGGLFIVNIGHKSYRFTSAQNVFELHNDVRGLLFYADIDDRKTNLKKSFKNLQKKKFQ